MKCAWLPVVCTVVMCLPIPASAGVQSKVGRKNEWDQFSSVVRARPGASGQKSRQNSATKNAATVATVRPPNLVTIDLDTISKSEGLVSLDELHRRLVVLDLIVESTEWNKIANLAPEHRRSLEGRATQLFDQIRMTLSPTQRKDFDDILSHAEANLKERGMGSSSALWAARMYMARQIGTEPLFALEAKSTAAAANTLPTTSLPSALTSKEPLVKSDQTTKSQRRRHTDSALYVGEGSGHWIEEVSGSGKIIELEDGSVWEVSPLDIIETALWLPVTDIIVKRNNDPLYPYLLINKDDGEKAHAKLLSP